MKKRQIVFDSLFVLLGAAAYSAAVNIFAAPNEIVQGGFTGLATMLNHLVPSMPVGFSIFLFNIPLFVVSKFRLGSRFVVKTLFVTAFFTFAIDSLAFVLPSYKGDALLASLFCGVLSGFGLGLVLLSGSTTGGTELVATLIRQKKPFVSIGRTMLAFDLAVIALSWAVFKKPESVMYAAVTLFVSSRTVDLVLYGAGHNKLIFVITTKRKEMTKKILSFVRRGVTEIDVTGGFSNGKKTLLLCAVRANEAAKINRIIKETDSSAFTIITEAGDVFGEGFR